MLSSNINNLQLIAATGLAAIAALWDLRTGRIPNRLVAAGALTGGCLALSLGALRGGAWGALEEASYALVGIVACTPLAWLLFQTRTLGGGDAKLFMALGAVLGPRIGLEVQWYALVLGTFYVVGVLVYRGTVVASVRASLRELRGRCARSHDTTPTWLAAFGPVICMSVCITSISHWSWT